MAGAVYENDVLQLIAHEEGRIRFKPQDNTLQYDYFIKDHLGNVRMVLTEEQQQDIYPAATLENTTYNGGTAISKEDDYYDVNTNNIVLQSIATGIPAYQNNNGNPPYNNNPYSNATANSARLYQLNAATNTVANKTGLGILLKVMSGDKISIFGKSYHKKPGAGYTSGINALSVANIIDLFTSTPLISGKGVTTGNITGASGFPTTIAGLLNNPPAQTGSLPRAGINWLVLDEQFKYVSGGFDAVGDAGGSTSGTFKSHSLVGLNIPKNGYLYVWCSNESQYNVFFDNLQVIHDRGAILEETHYYPFGLVMQGISSKAAGSLENKWKWNAGSELNTDFDINLYETPLRSLDPQIGRWHQIDSKPDYSQSLYASMGNNPILFNDPMGDTLRFPNAGFSFYITFRLIQGFLTSKGIGGDLENLEKSPLDIRVQQTTGISRYSGLTRTIFWNPFMGIVTTRDVKLSPATILTHEADHANKDVTNRKERKSDTNTKDENYDNKEEKRVIAGSEQKVAQVMGEIKKGEVTRTDHSSIGIFYTPNPISNEGKIIYDTMELEPVIITSTKAN